MNLDVAKEERSLVKSFAPHPARYFVVALTGVARTTRGHNVVERVATAARQRQNTIALHWLVGHATIRTATPLVFERRPLSNAEVVLNVVHTTLAFTSRPRLPASINGHSPMLTTSRLPQRDAEQLHNSTSTTRLEPTGAEQWRTSLADVPVRRSSRPDCALKTTETGIQNS
jgi:hypothetical protein